MFLVTGTVEEMRRAIIGIDEFEVLTSVFREVYCERFGQMLLRVLALGEVKG